MTTHLIPWDAAPPPECRGGAVTVGNFDGVHRGHQALLAALREEAEAVSGPAVALTFDLHPLTLLRPGKSPPALTTLEDRCELLHAHGAAQVVVLRTTTEFLHLRAREFCDDVLRSRLGVRALVPGFNFGFGRNREGNVETLRAFCEEAGLRFRLVPPLELEGKPVSSARIRGDLERGDVRCAAVLLGRPYRVRGTVVTGAKRGRTLGFPTANLDGVTTLIPGNGVYAVRAWHEGKTWPAAANVGPNPTFGEQARKLEVHLIGFDDDLYGKSLAIDFVQRIRDTRPFSGPAELVEQLRRDIELAARVGQV